MLSSRLISHFAVYSSIFGKLLYANRLTDIKYDVRVFVDSFELFNGLIAIHFGHDDGQLNFQIIDS